MARSILLGWAFSRRAKRANEKKFRSVHFENFALGLRFAFTLTVNLKLQATVRLWVSQSSWDLLFPRLSEKGKWKKFRSEHFELIADRDTF